jgi:hypothetical protein
LRLVCVCALDQTFMGTPEHRIGYKVERRRVLCRIRFPSKLDHCDLWSRPGSAPMITFRFKFFASELLVRANYVVGPHISSTSSGNSSSSSNSGSNLAVVSVVVAAVTAAAVLDFLFSSPARPSFSASSLPKRGCELLLAASAMHLSLFVAASVLAHCAYVCMCYGLNLCSCMPVPLHVHSHV